MTLLLDTNRYSDLRRSVPLAVVAVASAAKVYLPFIVVGELRAAFIRGGRRQLNERLLADFTSSTKVGILYADDRTTQAYADISAKLRLAGSPIPQNDIWIAALAIQHGLQLYTRDRHFDRVPGLSLL